MDLNLLLKLASGFEILAKNLKYDSKFRDLLNLAESQGFRIERSRKGHYMVIPPDKTKEIVVISGTPSDHREYYKALSRLKRNGLKIDEIEE